MYINNRAATSDLIKGLRGLESNVFDNMGGASQKTIDLVQESAVLLDRDLDDEPMTTYELGAISYECGLILEIINPDRSYDIDVIRRIQIIIDECLEEVRKEVQDG